MDEYSRIVIEKYCMDHHTTKKADFYGTMLTKGVDYDPKKRISDIKRTGSLSTGCVRKTSNYNGGCHVDSH